MIAFLRWLARHLIGLDFVAVAAVAALSVATEQVFPLALGVALAGLALRWFALGVPSVRTPADLTILALASMALFSLTISEQPAITEVQVMRLLLGMALFYALVNWAVSHFHFGILTFGIMLAGVVLTLGATISVTWMSTKLPFIPPEVYGQPSDTPYEIDLTVVADYLNARIPPEVAPLLEDSVNPNVMAGYLAVLFPVIAAPLFFNLRGLWWLSLPWLAILSPIGAMLLFTQSRGALLGFGAALVVLLMLYLYARRLVFAGMIVLFFVVMVGQGRLIEVYGAPDQIPYRELISTQIPDVDRVTDRDLPARIEIWDRAIRLIRDFPVTGVGMGLYAPAVEQYYPFETVTAQDHAHNLVLQVGVDLGIPGLLAWLATLFVVIGAALHAFQRAIDADDRFATGFAAGLVAAQAALLVHGIFDAVTWGMVRPAILIWVLWGAAIAVLRLTFAQPSPDKNALPARQAS
ncbi:O-antigen ligase family protein [Candidatus Chloroploca asiatica]|uniref:O-antigen ligase-related domain-containing protein n=1 Tax=Candidatus Chloroploca asiatica TaxID=1506545 RepID=A0A2H3L3P8_9CHLR|nr:O-antigen ligase family protein [Candidatus Chloroploca asiatica]PDV96850.1 hypothetical protein A9Q02_20080 [Candidatus Chloroploca asiatica]